MWVEIRSLRREVKVCERVRVYNGHKWHEVIITPFWFDRGYVPNGIECGYAKLSTPSFGKYPEVWIEDENN